MEIGTLTTAFIAARTAQVQLAVAAAMLRTNVEAEASVIGLIDAAQQNAQRLATASTGIGSRLDLAV
jgi:hypothetical protein